MQPKQRVPAHSKILPTQIGRVDGLKNLWNSMSSNLDSKPKGSSILRVKPAALLSTDIIESQTIYNSKFLHHSQ